MLLEVIIRGLTLLTQLQRCQVLSTDLRFLPMVNVSPGVLLDVLKQKKIKGSMKDLEELLNDWIMKIVKFIKKL